MGMIRWRGAVLLLAGMSLLARAFERSLAALLEPVLGGYFDPAGTARALAHGIALLGLVRAACTEPSETPAVTRLRSRPAAALYQI